MKKILIAAMVVATAAVAVESSAAPTADAAIKQAFVELDRCFANNDTKCVGELLVEDATFAAPFAAPTGGTQIVKGKAQIVKTLAEVMGTPPPNMKGMKRTHSVENVRMIGEDHAVVDSSVELAGTKPDGLPWSYHAVAVMVLKGDKWLFEDLRSYVVEVLKKPAPTATK